MSRRAHISQKIAFSLLFLSTVFVVIPVVAILVFIVKNGVGAISWEFLTSYPRAGMKQGGIFPAIVGTFYLVFGAIAVSLPIGVLAAIFIIV